MNNEPAFPCECSFYDGKITGKQTGQSHGIATGLTKREYFAAMAMQGILASDSEQNFTDENVSAWAVNSADALLAELAKARAE